MSQLMPVNTMVNLDGLRYAAFITLTQHSTNIGAMCAVYRDVFLFYFVFDQYIYLKQIQKYTHYIIIILSTTLVVLEQAYAVRVAHFNFAYPNFSEQLYSKDVLSHL